MQKDAKRQREHQHVRKDGNAGAGDVKLKLLVAGAVGRGKGPVGPHGAALQHGGQGGGGHGDEVERVGGVDGPPHGPAVAAQPQQEHEHGRLAERQDRVVKHLHDVVPPARPGEVQLV